VDTVVFVTSKLLDMPHRLLT